MSDSKSTGKSALPPWAIDSLMRFKDRKAEVGLILALSMRGILSLPGRHRVMKIVANMPGPPIYGKEILERAAYERDLAQREIDNGFPLLHEQATVALWSSLRNSCDRSAQVGWRIGRELGRQKRSRNCG